MTNTITWMTDKMGVFIDGHAYKIYSNKKGYKYCMYKGKRLYGLYCPFCTNLKHPDESMCQICRTKGRRI